MLEMRIGALVGTLAMALGAWIATAGGRPWWHALPALVALHVPGVLVDAWRKRQRRFR